MQLACNGAVGLAKSGVLHGGNPCNFYSFSEKKAFLFLSHYFPTFAGKNWPTILDLFSSNVAPQLLKSKIAFARSMRNMFVLRHVSFCNIIWRFYVCCS